MAEQQLSAKTVLLLKLKNEMLNCMKDLNDRLTLSMKTLSNDRSKRFDEHTKSNKFSKATFNGAKSDAFESGQQVSELKIGIAEQRITIKMLNKKSTVLKHTPNIII